MKTRFINNMHLLCKHPLLCMSFKLMSEHIYHVSYNSNLKSKSYLVSGKKGILEKYGLCTRYFIILHPSQEIRVRT